MLNYRKWTRIGEQIWEDIYFLHWPVNKEEIRSYIPEPFTINEYEGMAWLSIVIFTARHTKFRKFPKALSYPSFHQINVRTYVNFGIEKGVYFFSIYANDPLFVKGGNLINLPFINSRIKRGPFSTEIADGKLSCTFSKTELENKFIPKRGSLEHFLTEKYCIWSLRGNKIIKLPITHLPWALQRVEVMIKENRLIGEKTLSKNPPIAYYAPSMTAFIHPPENFGIYKK